MGIKFMLNQIIKSEGVGLFWGGQWCKCTAKILN